MPRRENRPGTVKRWFVSSARNLGSWRWRAPKFPEIRIGGWPTGRAGVGALPPAAGCLRRAVERRASFDHHRIGSPCAASRRRRRARWRDRFSSSRGLLHLGAQVEVVSLNWAAATLLARVAVAHDALSPSTWPRPSLYSRRRRRRADAVDSSRNCSAVSDPRSSVDDLEPARAQHAGGSGAENAFSLSYRTGNTATLPSGLTTVLDRGRCLSAGSAAAGAACLGGRRGWLVVMNAAASTTASETPGRTLARGREYPAEITQTGPAMILSATSSVGYASSEDATVRDLAQKKWRELKKIARTASAAAPLLYVYAIRPGRAARPGRWSRRRRLGVTTGRRKPSPPCGVDAARTVPGKGGRWLHPPPRPRIAMAPIAMGAPLGREPAGTDFGSGCRSPAIVLPVRGLSAGGSPRTTRAFSRFSRRLSRVARPSGRGLPGGAATRADSRSFGELLDGGTACPARAQP